MQNNILTISQLNYTVRHLLEGELGLVWLVGEISNLSKPVSGHWYLTLKDEQAQVRCAMFRMKNMRVTFPVQNGMQVLVRASVSLYEPRGDYQVIIESMQPAGDGLLQQRFEQLKMKLAGEGLFAQEHKKPLPSFIKRVGIVTSASGAVLQDILNILKRRDPSLSVVIYPTMVQGKEATAEIVRMIELANLRRECDVLIVGRGGGSLEDLWCFNEEAVAYALFHSEIPVISAVGHETDVTIADFVADLRAPTPSAAAELVSRDQLTLLQQLQQLGDRASFAFDRLWAEKTANFTRLQLRLNAQHPQRQLIQRQQWLSSLQQRATRSIQHHYALCNTQLTQLEKRLRGQHPLHRIQRQQQQLVQLRQRAEFQLLQQCRLARQEWQFVTQRLNSRGLTPLLERQQDRLVQAEQRAIRAIQQYLNQRTYTFQRCCTQLEGLSPLKILSRGYSVTKNQQGRALVNAQAVQIGEKITTRLETGEIVSTVVAVNNSAV